MSSRDKDVGKTYDLARVLRRLRLRRRVRFFLHLALIFDNLGLEEMLANGSWLQ